MTCCQIVSFHTSLNRYSGFQFTHCIWSSFREKKLYVYLHTTSWPDIAMQVVKIQSLLCSQKIRGLSQYKESLSRYGDSHDKDKTVSWLSYLYNGNQHTWKDCLYIEMGPSWKSIICINLDLCLHGLHHYDGYQSTDDKLVPGHQQPPC